MPTWSLEKRLWASVIVVVGALTGNYLGIMGLIDRGWFWFGNQGLSYLQLGRFWQMAFFVALIMWSWHCSRALAQPCAVKRCGVAFLDGTHPARASHLGSDREHRRSVRLRHDTADGRGKIFHHRADYWRWWVVHLWVEQSFEFYAGHHLYWNGTPGLWVPFGMMFSFIEVLP